MKVALIGTGAYGIAMAMMLNKNNKDIIMWTESEEKMKDYEKNGCIKDILPGIECPPNIKLTNSYEEAMQDREHFTIPLGEDKYFLQRGNDNYGIHKSVSNFSYVIVDNSGNYVGYVNILRSEGRHVEIEIGVSPKIQSRGLGRKSLEAFYQELFRVGYASITSCVFDFNTPSIKLHDRVAEFNGVRIESYYANNRLWNMNYYTVVNPLVENFNNYKSK